MTDCFSVQDVYWPTESRRCERRRSNRHLLYLKRRGKRIHSTGLTVGPESSGDPGATMGKGSSNLCGGNCCVTLVLCKIRRVRRHSGILRWCVLYRANTAFSREEPVCYIVDSCGGQCQIHDGRLIKPVEYTNSARVTCAVSWPIVGAVRRFIIAFDWDVRAIGRILPGDIAKLDCRD